MEVEKFHNSCLKMEELGKAGGGTRVCPKTWEPGKLVSSVQGRRLETFQGIDVSSRVCKAQRCGLLVTDDRKCIYWLQQILTTARPLPFCSIPFLGKLAVAHLCRGEGKSLSANAVTHMPISSKDILTHISRLSARPALWVFLKPVKTNTNHFITAKSNLWNSNGLPALKEKRFPRVMLAGAKLQLRQNRSWAVLLDFFSSGAVCQS